MSEVKDKKALTAPCGLDCFNCQMHEDNLTDELADLLHTKHFTGKFRVGKGQAD